MDYLGGRECKQTLLKAKWNVSPGLKQLKITKRKVELKGKTWKCEAEGIFVWGDFISQPEKCTVKQLQRWLLCCGAKTTGKKISCLWYSIKCKTRGVSKCERVVLVPAVTTVFRSELLERWLTSNVYIRDWKNVVAKRYKPWTMRFQGFVGIRSLAKQIQSSFDKTLHCHEMLVRMQIPRVLCLRHAVVFFCLPRTLLASYLKIFKGALAI